MLTNNIPIERVFHDDGKTWYEFNGFDKKGNPKIGEIPSGCSSSYNRDVNHYYFSDNKQELIDYWLGVKNDPNDDYNKEKITVTGKDFIENIINVLQEKGEISIGIGDKVNEETFNKLNREYKNLFEYLFRLGDTIGNNKFLSEKFNSLSDLGHYYYYYVKANGKEPFSLPKIFFDYLKVGVEYGWTGNPFYICTNKKLSKKEITVSYLYCNSNAGLPVFGEEEKMTFDLNPNEALFIINVVRFHKMFKYPNMQHYDRGQKNLIESIEESISRNKAALKILKRIYK